MTRRALLAPVEPPTAAAAAIGTVRDFEAFLRKNGWSAGAAKSIAAGGFKTAADRAQEAENKVLAASIRAVAARLRER